MLAQVDLKLPLYPAGVPTFRFNQLGQGRNKILRTLIVLSIKRHVNKRNLAGNVEPILQME
ncbi:hypothetical protein C4B60_18555 [Jeotgalibacillus proteolyticus]|uniref:Uncharacterized protein n=1 Tax=Jeotgalibacillus proteolyticus TaxID=2082395 RepID=A0A2S5G7F0_9BACL|nr:hypothetical protein C4B60_18555 [Jeotgalibacillus proteolyticus]